MPLDLGFILPFVEDLGFVFKTCQIIILCIEVLIIGGLMRVVILEGSLVKLRANIIVGLLNHVLILTAIMQINGRLSCHVELYYSFIIKLLSCN